MRSVDVGVGRCVFNIEFEHDDKRPGINIKVNVGIGDIEADFIGFYDLTEMNFTEIVESSWSSEDDFDATRFQSFMEEINENASGIQHKILRELHKSKKGLSLYRSNRAQNFFERSSQAIYTGLIVFKGLKVLLFSRDNVKLKGEIVQRLEGRPKYNE